MNRIVACVLLGLAACGGSAAMPPNTAVLPKGAGFWCPDAGESIRRCARDEITCVAFASEMGDKVKCAQAPSAFCMTYKDSGKDHWVCATDGALCNKFADFLRSKDGKTDVSSCVVQN